MKVLNQKYHVVFQKGKLIIRRPWKGKDVEEYSSEGRPAKDGKPALPAMFGDWEERKFLEPLGPFVLITIENKKANIAKQILDEGYTLNWKEHPDDPGIKSKWFVSGYYVRDDSVVYVMTPEPMSDLEFFRTLGLRVDLENNWDNSFKVGKYMKRLYSPSHREYMQGKVIKDHGNVIQVRLNNGRVLSVKYADHGKLTDGMSLVSTHCMKMIGLKAQEGQGLRITALSPKGFSKGHAIVLDGLQHDLVLFNSKKMLFGEDFTFGFDWLHDGGAIFTDIQSYVNFRFVEKKFLLHWSETYMETVVDAVQDTEKLRRMLEFYKVDTHVEEKDGEQVFVENDKEWTLLNALRHGVDIQAHPALMRRYFNLFTKTVMNCETDMRTPIPQEVGGARYAIVDPSIFDMWGDPTLEGELRGNTVYCDDKVGEVVFHRQPNGHRNEHHIAKTIQSTHLKGMDTGCFMFMSRDMIVGALDKLGGGDQDDRLVYFTDQSVVDHFKLMELDPYPVVEKIKEDSPKPKPNHFEHMLRRTPRYDRDQLLVMLDQMKKQSVSIGYVVNALMQDTCLTDHKEIMLKNLCDITPRTLKIQGAIDWLTKYEGNVLRVPGSQLEDFIDAVKKTGSDKTGAGDIVRAFNGSYMVTAEFFTRGGDFGGRIPQSRRTAESAPIVVRCSIDDEIEEVKDMRKSLEDIVTRISWQMMKPVPEEIITYPTVDPVSKQLALAMRQNYRNQWANLEHEDPGKAYQKIDESLYNQYKDHPLILDAIVHLYSMVMENRQPDAPLQKDGSYKKFPDGILWGTFMSQLTIRMLEMVGLAGKYVPANIDPEFKRMKRETVPVEVYKNLVLNEKTGEVLGGITPTVLNQSTLMERGFVKILAPYRPQASNWISLSVVNGWGSKEHTPADLIIWHEQSQREVQLVPYVFTDPSTREEEHAVRVMLDGKEYGHLSRKDSVYVVETKQGWLADGDQKHTMQVICER